MKRGRPSLGGVKAARRRTHLRIRELISRYKMKPCADCGIQYNPWIMQFDHLDPSQKKFTIGEMRKLGVEVVRAEIEKCDIVCANCHQERTHANKAYLNRKVIVPVEDNQTDLFVDVAVKPSVGGVND